jgi:3-oxoadipate CoA-transferase alpha subunit
MIDKRVRDTAAAVTGLKDGATILFAGFGGVGEPTELVHAVYDLGVRDLVIVSNNAGVGEHGIAKLIKAGRVRKVVCSFARSSKPHADDGTPIEVEMVPQGTLSERIRAGAAGIAGFYTRVSAGTALAAGKEVREFDGHPHVLERPIKGDIALIKADRADRWGNLTYRLTAQNFNPVMAMAGTVTAVQVREIVDLGAFEPVHIHTPGIFVDRVVVV